MQVDRSLPPFYEQRRRGEERGVRHVHPSPRQTTIIKLTSFFQRPPGVGAKLEKGAPPPFDPPDLVPRFARPNPELDSLAQPFLALPGLATLFCHQGVLVASWRFAPLRIPLGGAFKTPKNHSLDHWTKSASRDPPIPNRSNW